MVLPVCWQFLGCILISNDVWLLIYCFDLAGFGVLKLQQSMISTAQGIFLGDKG